MEFQLDSIRFRINVDFPDSDVDVVFTESRSHISTIVLIAGERRHTVKSQTPTSSSVDACLDILHDSKELQSLGVEMVEWHGLMMGCCHFWIEVAADKYTPELPGQVTKIAQRIFARRIKYYKSGQKLAG
jgi:hypothetical protein